tara:strand:+ start:13655 stop:15580 length:1926 start_codon:yes stop_codon:yes gene_type:complete
MACNLTGITINMGGGISPYNISLCDQGCESGCNNVASTNYDCVYFTACCGTYGLKIVDASGCTTCSDLIIDTCFTTTTTTTAAPATTTTTTQLGTTTTTTTSAPTTSSLFRPCDGQSGCTSGSIITPTVVGGGGTITSTRSIMSLDPRVRVKGATISTDPIYSGYTDSDGAYHISYYDYIVNKYSDTFTSTGLTSIHVGRKITNNIDTEEYCITLNVIEKKELSELSNDELLPTELDGIPTDVKVTGEIVLHSSCLYDANLIVTESTQCIPNHGFYGGCGGPYTSMTIAKCADHGVAYYTPATSQRAIPGGVSIGTSLAPASMGGHGSGTLGWLAYDNVDDRIVGITNNHVIGYNFAPAGLNADPVNYPGLDCGSAAGATTNGGAQPPNWTTGYATQQPSYPDNGGSSVGAQMGSVKRFHPLCYDYTQNKVDGAVIELTEEPTTTILGLAWGPFQHATTAELNGLMGSYVYKVGRSTGNILSVSYPDVVITSVNASGIQLGNPNFRYNNQLMFQSVGDGDPASSVGGDSGSALLCCIGGALKIVGLNFAGNYPRAFCCNLSLAQVNAIYPNGWNGIANRIDEVEDKLNISAWDGSIVVSTTASNYIKVNDKCYYNAGTTTRPIQHTIDASYTDCADCNSSI